MKLARPNVFHPRIVLASGRRLSDGGDPGLVEALRRRGLSARWMSWDDPQTEKADLVILAAASAPADRCKDFLAWTTRVRHLLNPPAVLAWNSATHHLADLAAAGIPMASRHATGRTTVLVFLGGEQSHAFSRSTAGRLNPIDPDFDLWDLGRVALDAVCTKVGIPTTELLYARVDLSGGTEAPSLSAIDLIEPDLGWRHLDSETRALQQRRFAVEVESACERLGLGPLSH